MTARIARSPGRTPNNHLLHALGFAGLAVAASALALITVTVVIRPTTAAAAPEPQSFSIFFDLATPDQPGIVEADGPISGQGAVFATERDTGHAFHETETFVFADGTLAVRANGVVTSSQVDPSTCTESSAFAGNFSITAGTGDFAAARGHGHFSGRTTITFEVNPTSPDGCDFDLLVSGSIHGEAIGRVRL